jgi:hypothetical protein
MKTNTNTQADSKFGDKITKDPDLSPKVHITNPQKTTKTTLSQMNRQIHPKILKLPPKEL